MHRTRQPDQETAERYLRRMIEYHDGNARAVWATPAWLRVERAKARLLRAVAATLGFKP